jgi:hypothetical protein
MTEMFESVNALDPDTAAVVDHLVPPPRSQGFALGVGVSLIALAIGFVTLWFGGLFRPQISVDGNWAGFIENLSGTSKPATVVLVVHNDGWFDSVMLGATDTAGTSMTIGDAQGETGRIELPAGESVEVTIRSTIDCSGTSGGPTLDWPHPLLVLEARSDTFPVTVDIVTDTDLPFDPSFC